MTTTAARKGQKGLAMEGAIARWYDRNTRNYRVQFRKDAERITATLAEGSKILEVAPGPGFLSIEIAKRGRYDITGMDLSRTFVDLATANAREAGVNVTFRVGNASGMPFDDNGFDFVVCQAAFKNFTEPEKAIDEMYRVLKPGCRALINDLRHDITDREIDDFVPMLGMSRVNAVLTRLTFKHMLRDRAFTIEQMRDLAARSAFGSAEVVCVGLAMDVWLKKPSRTE